MQFRNISSYISYESGKCAYATYKFNEIPIQEYEQEGYNKEYQIFSD